MRERSVGDQKAYVVAMSDSAGQIVDVPTPIRPSHLLQTTIPTASAMRPSVLSCGLNEATMPEESNRNENCKFAEALVIARQGQDMIRIGATVVKSPGKATW